KFTDSRGHVNFPSFEGFSREKTPVAFIVSKGSDLSFIPYNGSGRRLDYSGFNTGGVYGVSDPDRLSSYLFSDRGIYRPGDLMNIGIIVKNGGWNRSLKNIPFEVSVIDSRGLEVLRERVFLDETGLQDISYKTEAYSPTGNYQVNLYSVKDELSYDLLGSTTVRVEEFEPDRLKITASFSKIIEKGWVSPEDLKGRVTLKNLFGTNAADNRVKGSLTLSPAYIRFREYRDYRFFDPLRANNHYQESLGEQKTDIDGNCKFDIDLSQFDSASYNLSFMAEAFEKEGGRSVVSQKSILVSPLEYLVGSKKDGDLSYIYRGGERSVNFIAVDPSLEKTTLNSVRFSLTEIRWISVLTKQPNGTYKYQSVEKEFSVDEYERDISADGLTHRLKTDLAGDFELVL
ncbi:MAG: alpha-2-macroglobulin family protein, partial [Proteobacteria bacterium]|nr:alpha-2-macroglobulin family protein [Pseudomonadota bacterium]